MFEALPSTKLKIIANTDPCENFESINTIIYCPFYIIHQIVCGASKHYGRNGTIFLFCQEI